MLSSSARKPLMVSEKLTLDQLNPGQRGKVTRIGGTGALRRRLMDMGIIRGVAVSVLKTAPLGDPIEYKLLGYHLSLRKSEAGLIEIEPE